VGLIFVDDLKSRIDRETTKFEVKISLCIVEIGLGSPLTILKKLLKNFMYIHTYKQHTQFI